MIHEPICDGKALVVGKIHKFIHQIQLSEYVYMNQRFAHNLLSRRELLTLTDMPSEEKADGASSLGVHQVIH